MNDPPVISASELSKLNTTVSEDQILSLNFSGVASDVDSSNLTWSVSTPNFPEAIQSIENVSDTEINIIPTPDANGPVTFQVMVSDGSATDTASLDTSWAFVEDAPEWIDWIGNGGMVLAPVDELYTFNLTGGIYDPDMVESLNRAITPQDPSDLQFSVVNNVSFPDWASLASNAGDTIFTGTPGTNDVGNEYTFALTVTDSKWEGAVVEQEMKLKVNYNRLREIKFI